TPREYARAERVARFGAALERGKPVAEAAYGAGFGSSSRAYQDAAEGLGMTPGARRSGGRGELIRYATAKTSLGWLLVAAAARGLCAAELGDGRDALVRNLRQRFARAVLSEDRARLGDWLARIGAFIASPDHALDLPLDVRGTAFQAQVWRALREIPPGRTASYAEIAAVLGRPRAGRAGAPAGAHHPGGPVLPRPPPVPSP